MLTDGLPRISLGFFPTPIHEMARLSAVLGGPRLWIKRDDQTGLASGGNKVRKLEFSVAEALHLGADTLITVGAVQSNHCRQTAAAAARMGLRCVLVINGYPPDGPNGNMLLNHLLGAEVVYTGAAKRGETAERVCREQEAAGHRPYMIPVGASNAVGAAGFVAGMEELLDQIETQDLRFDRIFLPSGSAGTQAGLCVGAKALGFTGKIAGISVGDTRAELQESVAKVACATSLLLGLPLSFSPDEIVVYDEYVGAGYSIMGEPEREAIDLAARYEGMLLDPVYTGRAMAGVIDLIRKGVLARDENILFWHTGGSPALYAYAEKLLVPAAANAS